jgi:hypothetical protein
MAGGLMTFFIEIWRAYLINLSGWLAGLYKYPIKKGYMKGKIVDIQPPGMSTVYNYICIGDDNNLLSFPVEARYHSEILEGVGQPIGREIEYDGGVEPPVVRFL